MGPGVQKVQTDSTNTLTMKNIVFIAGHLPTVTGVSRLQPESMFMGTARINASTAAPPILAWAVNIAPPANTKNKLPKSGPVSKSGILRRPGCF
jgi:hypothetical protein